MELNELFTTKLGFGGLRLPSLGEKNQINYDEMNAMVDEYVSCGGCYFDTSYIYHRGMSECAMAACVVDRLPRESFCLADKLPTWKVGGMNSFQDIFEDQCKKCHVDYFDFYLLHNINSNSITYVEEMHEFDFLFHLKEEGKIRYAGFSFHDTAERLDQLLTKYDSVDFVQLQLNYYDWLSNYVQAKKCYEVATAHNKPVIVMETVRGGGLTRLPKEAEEIFKLLNPQASPASYAIRFAASLENVIITLSGMSNLDQVRENCSYMAEGRFQPFCDVEYEAVEQVCKMIKKRWPVSCDNCGRCEMECSQHIPIARLLSIYNDGQFFGGFNFPDMHYNIHTKNAGKAGNCIGCGTCEQVCPQKIAIRDQLQVMSALYDRE